MLFAELFYAIIPTLFLCFLLICYPYILLHFYCFYMYIVNCTYVSAFLLLIRKHIYWGEREQAPH